MLSYLLPHRSSLLFLFTPPLHIYLISIPLHLYIFIIPHSLFTFSSLVFPKFLATRDNSGVFCFIIFPYLPPLQITVPGTCPKDLRCSSHVNCYSCLHSEGCEFDLSRDSCVHWTDSIVTHANFSSCTTSSKPFRPIAAIFLKEKKLGMRASLRSKKRVTLIFILFCIQFLQYESFCIFVFFLFFNFPFLPPPPPPSRL